MRDSEKAFPVYEADPTSPPVQLKLKLRELWDIIEDSIPNSRARSIALTNLETAGMYAVKAIHQGAANE